MATRLAILLLALQAACHHEPPHHPGEEWLKSVRFEGNHHLSDDDLIDGLALHRTEEAGRPPDPYLVQLDADRLRGRYARDGYFATDVQSRVERQRDAATVTYTIQEGARASTRVDITGLPPDVPAARVRALLPLADGAPFDYEIYDQAKVLLLGVVQDAGYAHAKLDAFVQGDLATRTATVHLAFAPGPKCTFGKIEIQGANDDLADAIRQRLFFHTGDTYSSAAIASTQRAVYGLDRFSMVQVEPETATDDRAVVDMKVAVVPSAAHQVTLGGGFGADPLSYEVRGRAGYSITGWPTPMDSVAIDLRPAYAYMRDGTGYEPRVRADAKYTRDDFLRTYAEGTVDVGYDYLAYEAFTLYGPRAMLGYTVRLGSPNVKLQLGWLTHYYDFRRPSPLVDAGLQAMIGIDHPELVGAYQASVIADFRDQPVEPRLGAYAAFAVTEGTPAAGGDYTYSEIQPEVRGYVPVGPIVLAARARYGAIWGDVPPSERFYAGGATSNRGFSERELSPSVSGVVMGNFVTVPYGGAGMIDTSGEVRFPIAVIHKMGLGGVVFVDAGDVEPTTSDLALDRIAIAVGAGLRLHTVVGPVRADLGYRLNRMGADDPEPGTTLAFHLSLGEAF